MKNAQPSDTHLLSAQIAQKQAELDQMRADNATVLKGVAKMAELAARNGETWDFHFYFNTDGDFCIDAKSEDWLIINHKSFAGSTPADAFAQLLGHFK